jgi:hypothetical protein
MTMTLEPIYGNGWTNGQGDIPEPSSFKINARHGNNGAIVGHIIASEEAGFTGAVFEATPRHLTLSSIYNCHIKIEGGATLVGYCRIS